MNYIILTPDEIDLDKIELTFNGVEIINWDPIGDDKNYFFQIRYEGKKLIIKIFDMYYMKCKCNKYINGGYEKDDEERIENIRFSIKTTKLNEILIKASDKLNGIRYKDNNAKIKIHKEIINNVRWI